MQLNPDMKGKTCIVTGATSGIGKATAIGLARLNATIVIVARDSEKGRNALSEIKSKTGNESVFLMTADLSSQKLVRQLAREFLNNFHELHVLVNNAGVFMSKRSTTIDGIESTFAINHLAPFLLTNLLLDALKASAPARIVNVSSSAHIGSEIDFNDLQGEKRYSGFGAYGKSKLANIFFTYALARRLVGTNVTANCLHPGVVRTGLSRNSPAFFRLFFLIFSPFLASPVKGALTSIHLASSPQVEGVSGKYFVRRKMVRSSRESYDEAASEQLWRVSAALTGLNP